MDQGTKEKIRSVILGYLSGGMQLTNAEAEKASTVLAFRVIEIVDVPRDDERQAFIDDAAKRNMAGCAAGYLAGDSSQEWQPAYMARDAYEDAEALWNEREQRRNKP